MSYICRHRHRLVASTYPKADTLACKRCSFTSMYALYNHTNTYYTQGTPMLALVNEVDRLCKRLSLMYIRLDFHSITNRKMKQ